jgi:ribosomal protein S18 acetylase RimI-like enzyme
MITIRPVMASDYGSWSDLYAGYAAFYQVDQTATMHNQVWTWLNDPTHEVSGFVAIDADGAIRGIIHYRPFSRPLTATTGGYIDDLFVSPEARGKGIAKQLINAVAQYGKENGWSVIRWITAEDNMAARKTYDAVASQTKWLTYDIKL